MRFVKFTIALALAVVLVGLGTPFASGATERLEVVSSFDTKVTVQDLAWDGKYLWAATGVAIYKFDTSGNTISSWYLYTSGIFPVGITWDGEYLWIVDAETYRNYKISKLDTSCNVVFSFVPDIGRGPVGIAWDGEHLWVTSTWESDIYELDTSGNVISSFSHQGPWGITWDGNYLWVPSSSDERIYQLDTSGNVISSFDFPGTAPRGMAWDGKHLWVSDVLEKRIYQLRVTTDNEAPSYTLNVSLYPAEGGSVALDPPGGTYSKGTVVTLTAQPAENYKFAGWSGDASGSDLTITVTMDSDKSIIASFQKISPPGPGEEFPAVWVGVGLAVIGAIAALFIALRRFG